MLKYIRLILKIILLLLLLFAAAVFGGPMIYSSVLSDYFANSVPVCRVPDLSAGFIPQGLAYDADSDCLFITGYMDNFAQSPIYVIDRKDSTGAKKVNMLTETGDTFKGHAGGVSIFEGQVYIAGSTKACVYSLPAAALLGAGSGEDLAAERCIDLRNKNDFIRASFTSVDDRAVYLGEFHKSPIFYTHRSHLVKQDGVKQKAYLAGFRMEGTQAVPVCVYSIPDNVQGACFHDGYVFLSRSHGFRPADILAYPLDSIRQEGTRSVLGKEVPLYILTQDNAAKITRVPPMSEEIIVVDGQLLILYEAASNRYMIGKKLGLDQIYATPVEYFK